MHACVPPANNSSYLGVHVFNSNVAPKRRVLEARKAWTCSVCGVANEKYWVACKGCQARP